MIKKYCSKQSIIGAAVLVSFTALALIIGKRHEPWADEAQAWLIARDLSVFDIIARYIRYEGSPALWHMVLKFFIFCGLPYRSLYLIPILFTSTGVFLIVFKSKFPLYIKALLPFSYYIFYQYTVVARSYCLLLPLLCFAAIFYEKKADKPAGYCLALVLLSGISTHTLLLAGFLFLLYLIDVFRRPGIKQDRKLLWSHIICSAVVCLSFLLNVISAFPPKDVSFTVDTDTSFFSVLMKIIFLLSKTMIAHEYTPIGFALGTLIFVSLLFFLYDKKLIPLMVFAIAPVLLFLSVFYCNEWHVGIMFLTSLFVMWVGSNEKYRDRNKGRKLLYILFAGVLSVQLFWTGRTVAYDYGHNYSAARETAEYIKQNRYEEMTLYSLGYSVTAIAPYFDENIFDNYNSDKAFYWWSYHNNYMTNAEIIEDLPDVVIISDFYKKDFVDVVAALEKEGYTKRFFEGNTFIKTQVYESESFIVYVSPDLSAKRINLGS